MISPAFELGSPLFDTRLMVPSSITQPPSGIASRRNPRQPFHVLPSKSSFHPADFSAGVSVFGRAVATALPPDVDFFCAVDSAERQNIRHINIRLAAAPSILPRIFAARASTIRKR